MDLILGIDFGTTNTVISYFENNKPNVLMDGVFKSIKSKLGIKDNNYSCGNYISLDTDTIIHSFKTSIGSDFNNNLLIIFFDHLKKIVTKKFSNHNLKSVITVPSNFNDIQREIIRNSFNNVGFNVIRIINEPSAAALAYGLINLNKTNDEDEKILVIDLGGGTLDLTILLKDNGFFEVEHSVGFNDLGGNDFTQVIYDYILNNNKEFNNKELSQLWYLCQNAKEKLSWIDNYEIKMKLNNNSDFVFNLNIKKFENLLNPLLNRLENILTHIKNNYLDIKYIIMVGNSTKIPILKDIIKRIFNITPWLHPNLESVVSEGACLYGAILEKKYNTEQNVILVDVLPLSLGVETADGNFSIIIPKDTPLPIKRTQKYTTDMPGDNKVTIKVYQGERLIANKNTLIGEFIFDKVSTCGTPQIDITFKVDTNSIITIIITDKKSGIEKNILIKDIPKLNSDDIHQIISNANINNKVDEDEMLYHSRIYILNNKIEIAMNNIKLNYLLSDDKKNELLTELYNIESKMKVADNTILLNLISIMDEKFLNLTQNIETIQQNDEKYNELEKIMIIELKDELFNKVTFLLNKNPEWSEYLTPIIENLSLTNISLEYLQDKLQTIKELEEDDDNTASFKEQFNNLCLFIKSQLEEHKIIIDNDKLNSLHELVNKSLVLLDNNNNEIDWEYELNNFNQQCELIYY
jgi:molecular chaperone DnaK